METNMEQQMIDDMYQDMFGNYHQMEEQMVDDMYQDMFGNQLTIDDMYDALYREVD